MQAFADDEKGLQLQHLTPASPKLVAPAAKSDARDDGGDGAAAGGQHRTVAASRRVSGKPFIVVVQIPFMTSSAFDLVALERLRWLANLFSHAKYPHRRLILIHHRCIWFVDAPIGQVLRDWECYDHWQDVYAKLLDGRYTAGGYGPAASQYWLDRFDVMYQFVFGVFINLREDKSEAGFGYGLPEVRQDRCPLRALLLATRGKAVCLDWGHPSDLGPSYRGSGSVAAVADMLDHNIRIYPDARLRWQGATRTSYGLPDMHSSQQPFARAIRNGHYLGTFSSKFDALPEAVVEDLCAGIDEHLFTEAQAKRGWWIGWWELFFAEDNYVVAYHRWRSVPHLQYAVVDRFAIAQHYWASSTRRESAIDIGALVLCGALSAGLDAAAFAASLPSVGAVLVSGPLTVALVTVAWDVWLNYSVSFVPGAQIQGAYVDADRPTHAAFAAEFIRSAVYAPVAVRPVLAVACFFMQRYPFLPRRPRAWYWGVRKTDSAKALRFEAGLTAALALLAWAVPWTSVTWRGLMLLM